MPGHSPLCHSTPHSHLSAQHLESTSTKTCSPLHYLSVRRMPERRLYRSFLTRARHDWFDDMPCPTFLDTNQRRLQMDDRHECQILTNGELRLLITGQSYCDTVICIPITDFFHSTVQPAHTYYRRRSTHDHCTGNPQSQYHGDK
jgi:hypothetical protein